MSTPIRPVAPLVRTRHVRQPMHITALLGSLFGLLMSTTAFAGNGTAQPIALRYSEGAHSISPSVRYLGDDSLLQSIWWLCRARGVVAKVNALPLRGSTKPA